MKSNVINGSKKGGVTIKKERNPRGIFTKFLIITCSIGLLYSGYQLYRTFSSYHKDREEYKQIVDEYTTSNEKVENNYKQKTYNYPSFQDVNFKKLKQKNKDVVGWIRIPSTIINYPILHSKDNKDYLHAGLSKQYIYAGSIFMDANNNENFTDKNTIIYGHNMKDGSMFGLLGHYLSDKKFYKEHPIIQIYTPKEKANYTIIGISNTTEHSKHYNLSFKDQNEYKNWLKYIHINSAIKVENYSEKKETITLSTCHGSSGTSQRCVVHLQKINENSN